MDIIRILRFDNICNYRIRFHTIHFENGLRFSFNKHNNKQRHYENVRTNEREEQKLWKKQQQKHLGSALFFFIPVFN